MRERASLGPLRIGILSDSHGRADTTRRAVRTLLEHRAEVLVHLGDVGSEAVIDELAGRNARLVWGNCDWDIAGLTRYARIMGVQVDHPMGVLELAGKRVAFTHGHLTDLMKQAQAEQVDYLLHGHSHELRDERVGPTRIINPGALSRASRYTAAILNTAADQLQIIEIARTDAVSP